MYETKTEEVRNETTGAMRRDYYFGKTEFAKTKEALIIAKFLTFLRMGLIAIVLTAVNVIASVRYTNFFKQKTALKQIIRGLDS
jgi:hypothetical protein